MRNNQLPQGWATRPQLLAMAPSDYLTKHIIESTLDKIITTAETDQVIRSSQRIQGLGPKVVIAWNQAIKDWKDEIKEMIPDPREWVYKKDLRNVLRNSDEGHYPPSWIESVFQYHIGDNPTFTKKFWSHQKLYHQSGDMVLCVNRKGLEVLNKHLQERFRRAKQRERDTAKYHDAAAIQRARTGGGHTPNRSAETFFAYDGSYGDYEDPYDL